MASCFLGPRIAADRRATACLGSSFLPSFRASAKPPSSRFTATGFQCKCVAETVMPRVAESLFNRLGINSHENMMKLHDFVLQGALQSGLPLPSQESTTWWWMVLAPAVLSYLFATPGSLAGLADFCYAPLHTHSSRSFSPDDVEIGRQLGEGSFGVVYEGFFGRGRRGEMSKGLHVVLKKAKPQIRGALEVHDSEIYMNYRLQRTASFACAEFLGTMQVKPAHAHGKLSEGTWLVWNFQGDRTLDYYLKQRNFPGNISAEVLGDSMPVSSREKIFKRNAVVIQTIFRQILSNLQDLHRSGVVHRDVKPLNLILDQSVGKFKFIDFGACVDLRSGYNYIPNETVIDPTYTAPEHYVMPTSTPHLPPDPICSLVSPLFWRLNTPDRFDLYSAGLILMQLSMRPLRHDNGLQTFNTELKRSGYNLNTWRANCRHSKDEFAYLDADDGAGWELATALLQPRHDRDHVIWPSLGNSRPSASAALGHRYLKSSFVNPQLFPVDPPAEVLPSIALKLTNATKNVTKNVAKPNNQNVPTPEAKKEKIYRPLLPVLPALPQVFNVSVAPDNHPSTLPMTETLSHAIWSAFNKRPERVDGNIGAPAEKKPQVVSKVELLTEELKGRVNAFEKRPERIDGNKADTRRQKAQEVSKVDLVTEEPKGRVNCERGDAAGKVQGVTLVEQNEVQEPADSSLMDMVSSSMGPALPMVASSAVTLATGWLVLSGLNGSAQASYELGKLLVSSSGISGSAFLAFFLVIKPWLEDQDMLAAVKRSEIAKEGKSAANENQATSNLERFKSVHGEPIILQTVVEAVQELEMQMSSLEALMLQEQQVARNQQELVQKMESLLLQPFQGSGPSEEDKASCLGEAEQVSTSML